jgi:hypothetical protein
LRVTYGQGTQAEPGGQDGTTQAEPGEQDGQACPGRKPRWRDRPSIRALAQEARRVWVDSDRRDNEASRLPDGEEVHLGGLVLVEVYPPSTTSALYRALEDLAATPDEKEKWTTRLGEGRSAAGTYGWQDLGTIRRSDRPGLFDVHIDRELPHGIDEVRPRLYFPTPSLTLMVATFTLTDQAGDLSELLRSDYQGEIHIDIRALGRFGSARSHIPWSRLARHDESGTLGTATDQRRLACEARIKTHEAACWTWMASKFPGRFSTWKLADRPAVRLLLTKNAAPFEDSAKWLVPAGMAFGPDVWRPAGMAFGPDTWLPPDPHGWFLQLANWPRDRRFTATAARSLGTAEARQQGGADPLRYLPYQFAGSHSSLVARWAMTCLVPVYADKLAQLRDDAGRRRPGSRPVRQGRDLDDYLIRDGLDASTVVSDLGAFTKDLADFRTGVPEYTEYLDPFPAAAQARDPPRELVPWLRELLRDQVERLARDTAATTSNVRASAELRQAVANTKLQRVMICLTIAAAAIAVIGVVVAIISLVVALHAVRH